MKQIFYCLFALTLFLGGCSHEEQAHDEHEPHAEHGAREEGEHEAGEEGEHGAIELHDEEIAEFGIEFTAAGPVVLRREISLPGEVHPNQDRLAHIVPRYPGIVREVRKTVGDQVKRGEVLAVIESNESLTRYEMRSLIDGVVLDRHITLGEVLQGDAPAFLVADLSEVWIDLAVFPKDLTSVQTGQRVRIHAGANIPETQGIISYVSPAVRDGTRTALARIKLPNPERVWRPGIFITGHVSIDEVQAPVGVPQSAVMELDGEQVVFVQDEHGIEPRGVQLGERDAQLIEIQSGLKPGEQVVSKGALLLKAEMQKGALDDDGHAH